MRPAGGLYPVHLGQNGEMRLDWVGGVTATVALSLWRAGADVSRFDLARLQREVESRANGHPWDLHLEAITREILAETFRVTDLVPQQTHQLTLELDGGPWSRADPFADVQTTDALQLADGFHLLLAVDVDSSTAAVALQMRAGQAATARLGFDGS